VTTDASTGASEAILVRYGELSLKGGNRPEFERALVANIESALARLARVRIERRSGRLVVFPERRHLQVARRLQDVFGIASVSPARAVEPTLEAIVGAARAALDEALDGLAPDRTVTVRVRTSRADKRFPMTSAEIDRHVADEILPRHDRLVVRLKGAEITVGIDLRTERAYVFAQKLPGPGGLPVGTLGGAVCLLSGGIDSPVAAWMAMKRGCRVAFVSFHSYPYIGEGSRHKIVKLVRQLARYQPESVLYSVPFAAIQETIRDRAPEGYRTVLYRRMMQRIATRIAEREGAGALVTGESLGQVASQTMENLTCIEDASGLPVLRPLIAFDKQETIDRAERIGTLELSQQPEPDCCTVFTPRKPVIRGRVQACREAEASMDVETRVEAALAGAERSVVEPF